MSDTKQALKEWLSYIPESQHGSIKQAIDQIREASK